MFSPEAFFPVLQRVASLLQSFGIRFHLTGGLVSSYYAEPRLTQDADLVVDPQQLQACLEDFLVALEQFDWLMDADVIRDAVRRSRMFQLIDVQDCVKVDIYPRELVPGELGRSQLADLTSTLQFPVAARPYLVISKLIWISKGSHKSRRDLRQLWSRCSAAEILSVQEYAGQHKLQDLLDEVLDESDEIDA